MIYKRLNKNISKKGLVKITTASDVDKAYVDNLDKENVKLTGDQNIYGSKTIHDSLRINTKYIFMRGNEIVDLTKTPKEDTSATCKLYVDNADKAIMDYINKKPVWEYVDVDANNVIFGKFIFENLKDYKNIYINAEVELEGSKMVYITGTWINLNFLKFLSETNKGFGLNENHAFVGWDKDNNILFIDIDDDKTIVNYSFFIFIGEL
ncbi:MAG: hypothetical protein ACRCUM_02340 [Mycoplasmoidaceae bacterium]